MTKWHTWGTLARSAGTSAALVAMLASGLAASSFDFTVSMPHPELHTYHVALRYGGPTGVTEDFTMPEWMPGYYGLMHYGNYVSHFEATNAAGQALGWEHTTESTWRVVTAHAAAVMVSYDVAAPRSFAASNSLDAQRGFIAPPGLFVYVPGELRQPATVDMEVPPGWTTIATGLDPVPGRPHTFTAPDFDTLYDCPWLLGSQETVRFMVRGIPHTLVLEDVPAGVSRDAMSADLQRIVSTATAMMDDIPYHRYVFLLMGRGNGGIEHLNSAAIAFNGNSLLTPAGYQGWLSYVAHEYFHNFNVKRIRPLALGPFDYQEANLTDMLWVSEGLTVYYEDLLVERSGLMSKADYLVKLAAALDEFENASGHRYQSATESSLRAWNTGSGVGADRATSISYYDNGALLGIMLDLAIREDSGNRASLDSVMRQLYRTYYQQDGRGFTDAEFQTECERAAGQPLDRVFAYASSTAEPDYAKYLAYAGLELTTTSAPTAGAYLGMNTQAENEGIATAPVAAAGGRGRGGRGAPPPPPPLSVTSVDADSPAATAGLRSGDVLESVENAPVTPQALNDLLAAKAAGDAIALQFRRDGAPMSTTATLAANRKLTFTITPVEHPTTQQAAILRNLLASPAAAREP